VLAKASVLRKVVLAGKFCEPNRFAPHICQEVRKLLPRRTHNGRRAAKLSVRVRRKITRRLILSHGLVSYALMP
jgi:hypothetical protein